MLARCGPRRTGYTLMEIVLVVALILISAAVAIPVWQSMLDDAKLTAASDLVRARMAQARARAMESGRPWRLACIPNTGVLQLAPEDSGEWDRMDRNVIKEAELQREELPKGIYFGTIPSDLLASRDPGSAGTTWQNLAVYLYDGSAREDTVIYFGKMSTMPMAAELRALTGSVTVRSPAEVKATLP